MSRGAELVRIDKQLQRCVEDADRARSRLIVLTSFAGADGLAAMNGPTPRMDVIKALNEYQQCAARCAELLNEKRDVATA